MIKGYQPAKFSPCSNLHCNEKEEKCQLANYTDSFNVQFNDQMNLLNYTNRILNGDFGTGDLTDWDTIPDVGDDWVYNSGHVEVIPNGGGNPVLYQCSPFDECVLNYYVQFDYVVPDCTLQFGFYDGTLPGTVEVVGEIVGSTSGTYTGFWEFPLDVAAAGVMDCIFFRTDGTSEFAVELDNIIVYGFTAAPVLRDCCDNDIKTIDPCDLYYTSGCGDDWGVAFNWNDYVSTLWKVKVCFPDMEMIKNSAFFFGNMDWMEGITGADWTFTSGLAEVTLTASTISKTLIQDTDLPPCDYSLVITYEVANPFSDGTVFLYLNGDLYDSVTVGAGPEANTTFAIDYDYHIETISIYYSSTANQTVSIDSISIVTDLCSECYCVGDHDCTNLIEARNNNDAFGLVFGATTVFSLRVESELLNYKDEATESIVEGSAGTNQLYFAQFKGMKDLKIYSEPEYIWEALQMMLRVTDLRINKQSYTKKEGNIEMTFQRTLQEYSGSVTVMKKSQDYKSYY